MRYAITRYNRHRRDVAYRIYVTDCLRMNLECVAVATGHNLVIDRFADMYNTKAEDNRTAEDIIESIRNKLE